MSKGTGLALVRGWRLYLQMIGAASLVIVAFEVVILACFRPHGWALVPVLAVTLSAAAWAGWISSSVLRGPLR